MIFDRIDYREKYNGLSMSIPKALQYLATTDFNSIPDGKQEIDGDKMFALVQRYVAKPLTQARWEIHRRYIDVQYIVSGGERFGYAPWAEGLPVDAIYDPQRDLGFYHTSGIFLNLSAGMFVILYPQELHAPSLIPIENPTREVLKVVVKCRWDEWLVQP